MKKEDDIKVKPRFVNRTGIPTVRTPVDYMGNEINNPLEKEIKSEDRISIVKKKHEAKYKAKTKTNKSKVKTKK